MRGSTWKRRLALEMESTRRRGARDVYNGTRNGQYVEKFGLSAASRIMVRLARAPNQTGSALFSWPLTAWGQNKDDDLGGCGVLVFQICVVAGLAL